MKTLGTCFSRRTWILAFIATGPFAIAGDLGTAPPVRDFNSLILESIREMPQGGGYAVNKAASSALTSSIQTQNGKLQVVVPQNTPSYCSAATYQVFLKTLEKLQNNGQLSLSASTLQGLGTRRNDRWLTDGKGLWGRWNANGPGVAAAFSELGLGHNFVDDDFSHAKPGDFMKIFWTDAVGKSERGHAVILTGVKPVGARGSKVEEVCFWSANQGQGYGEKCVPRSKVKKALFSRLTKPENINSVASMPETNTYLASLLSKESSFTSAVSQTQAWNVKSSNATEARKKH